MGFAEDENCRDGRRLGRFVGTVNEYRMKVVQFQPQARFRSEGPEVSSPVREDGELRLLIARKARRAGTNCGAPSVLR